MKKNSSISFLKVISVSVLGMGLGSFSHSMSLDEYLLTVEDKHRTVKALKIQKEASDSKKMSGDIGLSPMLTLSVAHSNDKNTLNSYYASESKIQNYSLGVAKKISTGTSLSVNATALDATNDGIQNSTTRALLGRFGTSSLGISVSQSLWKDFAGQSTELRHERENLISQMEKLGYELQIKQILVESEATFWDYIYLTEDLKNKKENLDRAKKIESWVRQRVNDGIGDKADLYNAQALVASREFQLMNSQDEFIASEKKIRDILEIKEDEVLPALQGDFNKSRSLKGFVQGTGKVVKMDSYLSVLESKTKAVISNETEEGLKSDLTLAGSYKTNDYESSMGKALGQITNTSTPTTQVALTWSYIFDNEAKDSASLTAKKEAKAAEIKKQRKLLESETAWTELQRRYDEVSKKIKSLEDLSRIQNLRAHEERQKLSRGRSITSQVITAEQDAAESILSLTKLKAEQRKMESQAKFFMTTGESL